MRPSSRRRPASSKRGFCRTRWSRLRGAAGMQLHGQPRTAPSVRAVQARTPANRSSLSSLQAKTVLFALDDRVWSFGVVGRRGTRYRSTARQVGIPGVYYAKALASWYPRERSGDRPQSRCRQRLRVRERSRLRAQPFNTRSSTNVQLLAEAFRDEPGPPKYQVGARFIIVPIALKRTQATAIDSTDRPTNGLRSLVFVCRPAAFLP